jgi:hypothetical protein
LPASNPIAISGWKAVTRKMSNVKAQNPNEWQSPNVKITKT